MVNDGCRIFPKLIVPCVRLILCIVNMILQFWVMVFCFRPIGHFAPGDTTLACLMVVFHQAYFFVILG